MEAKQNMRVDVYDLDKHYLGAGIITKVEPLEVEMEDGTVEVLVENYPAEIRLDNGEITEGMNCWWAPINIKKIIDNEEYMKICQNYDPDLCKTQCILCNEAHEDSFKGNCVDGGGVVTWEIVKNG